MKNIAVGEALFHIELVGKAMGETKFHNHMSGSMLPSGEIGAAKALSIAFGLPVEKVDAILSMAEKKEFDRIYKKHIKEAKEADRKWKKSRRKT